MMCLREAQGFINQFGKLCAFRAHVLYVPTCVRAFVAYNQWVIKTAGKLANCGNGKER